MTKKGSNRKVHKSRWNTDWDREWHIQNAIGTPQYQTPLKKEQLQPKCVRFTLNYVWDLIHAENIHYNCNIGINCSAPILNWPNVVRTSVLGLHSQNNLFSSHTLYWWTGLDSGVIRHLYFYLWTSFEWGKKLFCSLWFTIRQFCCL